MFCESSISYRIFFLHPFEVIHVYSHTFFPPLILNPFFLFSQVLAPFRAPRTHFASDGSPIEPLFVDRTPILLAERRHKYVKRLSLLFDDEDANVFFQRLQLAQLTRQAALAQKRLHGFVQVCFWTIQIVF